MMRKFLFKSIIFILPIVLCAFVLQPIVDNYLKQTNCVPGCKEWNDIFESKVNADLIIQGSSRARKHFSPKYLDSVFHINSYNLGMDGYPFHMQYYRFLIYMRYNKKPKYIIQVTDFLTFQKRTDLYAYEQFIPYLDNNLIREAVIKYDGLDERDFYIPLYKYHRNRELIFSAINGLHRNSLPESANYKGFHAEDLRWDTTFQSFKNAHPKGYMNEIDTMTLRLFNNFVVYCVKEKIHLVFVNPPIYWEANKVFINQKSINSIYLNYAQKYNIPYLDYSNDSIGLDTTNFYSATHLNVTGVIKFNTKLSNDLKRIIK
jgi:hypothetical protein